MTPLWPTLLVCALVPPAPPGATVRIVERVYAPFQALGTTAEFTAARRQSVSSVFSSYTGIATTDILTTVASSSTVGGVDVTVDHTVPSGTSGASIASALNNGIMRSESVLQAALQNTGGTIVTAIGSVSIVEGYEYVYPPPGPGPPLSETLIIVIAVGGVLALIALIGVARYCDAGKLRETTRLLLGLARTVTGGGAPAMEEDKKTTPVRVVVTQEEAARVAPTETNGKEGRTAVARGRDLLRQMLADDDDDTKRSVRVNARP